MSGIVTKVRAFPYSGIFGVAGFALWVVLTELGPSWLGADNGAFLYVTLHFIINPVLGLVVGITAALHGIMQKTPLRRVLGVAVSAFPFWVSYLGVTGSTWLTEALGVQFYR
jgi:hypothetical protein